jgi:alkylation response protein AidB-like acyl-CoA dehydrogenase
MIVDLIPDEDQSAIEDTIVSFLADVLPVERLRETANHGGAAESAVWSQLCELGLFGLGLSEEQGGLGLGLPEEALVARALGRKLVSPSVLAQLCAPHLATDEATRDALISGEARAAFAIADGYVLDGAGADWVVVFGPGGASLHARQDLEARPLPTADWTTPCSSSASRAEPAIISPRCASRFWSRPI